VPLQPTLEKAHWEMNEAIRQLNEIERIAHKANAEATDACHARDAAVARMREWRRLFCVAWFMAGGLLLLVIFR
jgi:hypothetical protein